MIKKEWTVNKTLSDLNKTLHLELVTDKQEQHSDEWKLFCACHVFLNVALNVNAFVPPARLHLAWPRLETPDATAGIWVITKGDLGGISENDSLFTSSLSLQSGYKRCRAFQRRRCAAFPFRRVANVEKRMERGKRRSRRECHALKNPSLMMPQEQSGREQTKVSKTSKGAFF